ncbi:hypothetical protein G7046_g4338 [Stylonectria norvegica]|nr:hypothetical protein G7046_g4338 [Stylonectria norvegica]
MASMGHFRTSSVVENGTRPVANNGVYSLPPGQAGRHGDVPRPGAPIIPHINDILAVPKDIDSNQSIKKLLEMAETSLRQAEISRDFRRPALALRDYIRASIIAVQVIRNHRDFTFLKGEREDLSRMHNALLKRISQQDESFARVKQEIIADNKRTGVKPTQRSAPLGNNGTETRPRAPSQPPGGAMSTALDSSNPGSPRSSLSSPGKSRPIVHPKPQSLHGNAINPGNGNNGKGKPGTSAQDLAARFAQLRGPQPSPGQDPRIKTHHIVPSKPKGPRDMPPPQKPTIGIDSNVPSLPKMPDAIYSPSRGSVSSETPRQPLSTPRTLYTNRTGSSASISGTPSATAQPQNDYFTPAQSYSNTSIPPAPTGNSIRIPEGDAVTPEELYQAMKGKGLILIIDVRGRDEFNEGHVMSSSTICIEPSILLRENISADEIYESLVVSPNQEQSLFEQRDKYDLVVFYDQDADQIPKNPRHSDDLVLLSLHQALVHFNYGRELRNSPKMLKGGLNAWVDLMGPASLQSTATATSQPTRTSRGRNPNLTIERRRSKYVVKPLKEDEVKVWQEALIEDDIQTASSPGFLRTTEDFLRRFPPVLAEHESMTTPTAAAAPAKPQRHISAYGLSHKVDLFTDLPSPPARPAPALPRPSYSGISQGADDRDLYGEANAAPARQATGRASTKAIEQQSTGDTERHYTGLNNPQNWCYANSALQSLLASPEFGRELADSKWMTNYKVPRMEDEKIDHPQLMARIISNLFHWMGTGKFKVMKAQTLMNYCKHLCIQGKLSQIFGGPQQHDAQEFMTFLFTQLHDETNTRRDREGDPVQPDTKNQSVLQAAGAYWRNHSEFSQSIIDRYWRGIELGTVECQECHTSTYQFNTMDFLPLTVNDGSGGTLEETLDHYMAGNSLEDFQCDHCCRKTIAMQSLSYARMPSLLCVGFRRFQYQPGNIQPRKSNAPITWDFNDMDLSRLFLKPKDCSTGLDGADQAFAGPFRYECYAVIVHAGSRIDNGHYYSYVRDPASQDRFGWYCCNDSRVTKVRIGCGGPKDVKEEVFKSGKDSVPYLVFFRRKGMRS